VWREIVRVQDENDRLRRELGALVRDRDEHIRQSVERQLDEFRGRRSWKLTAPLRWLYTVLHRGHRPA
jgi:hypothetical protein